MMNRRWSINISPGERFARVLLGLIGAVGGVWLLAGSPTTAIAAFEVLLVLAGIDLIVTGALGHCPLYQKLGHVPSSLRRIS